VRRREFITLLGGAAAWPLAARAQQPAKLPTIGFLGQSTRSAASEWVAAFVQRLRELGWIENRTVAIDYRWAEGRDERFADIAAEFVRLKVDVIVTSGTPAVSASKQATSVIPIIFATRSLSEQSGHARCRSRIVFGAHGPIADIGRIEIPQCSDLPAVGCLGKIQNN
jgi:putative ABC transport system substrate-binding protein